MKTITTQKELDALKRICDEFRNEIGDRYIAIRVALVDVYVWEDHPSYPYKIGFRKGKVLYECDRFGEKITEDGKIEVKK